MFARSWADHAGPAACGPRRCGLSDPDPLPLGQSGEGGLANTLGRPPAAWLVRYSNYAR